VKVILSICVQKRYAKLHKYKEAVNTAVTFKPKNMAPLAGRRASTRAGAGVMRSDVKIHVGFGSDFFPFLIRENRAGFP